MNKLLGFLLVASAVPFASADVVYSNDFSTSDLTGWSGTNSTSVSVASGQLVATNATNITRTSLAFNTVTLNVGDSLSLSTDLKVTSTVGSSVRRIYAGLWNTTTDQGYLGWTPSTTVTGQADAVGYSAAFPTTGVLSGTSLASGTDYLGTSSTALHTITLKITRTDLGLNLDYSFTNDSGAIKTISTAITSNLYYTFDHFDVSSWGNNNYNFNLDNVSLVYTPVPEPGTYGLIGAALLASCAYARRRRRRV